MSRTIQYSTTDSTSFPIEISSQSLDMLEEKLKELETWCNTHDFDFYDKLVGTSLESIDDLKNINYTEIDDFINENLNDMEIGEKCKFRYEIYRLKKNDGMVDENIHNNMKLNKLFKSKNLWNKDTNIKDILYKNKIDCLNCLKYLNKNEINKIFKNKNCNELVFNLNIWMNNIIKEDIFDELNIENNDNENILLQTNTHINETYIEFDIKEENKYDDTLIINGNNNINNEDNLKNIINNGHINEINSIDDDIKEENKYDNDNDNDNRINNNNNNMAKEGILWHKNGFYKRNATLSVYNNDSKGKRFCLSKNNVIRNEYFIDESIVATKHKTNNCKFHLALFNEENKVETFIAENEYERNDWIEKINYCNSDDKQLILDHVGSLIFDKLEENHSICNICRHHKTALYYCINPECEQKNRDTQQSRLMCFDCCNYKQIHNCNTNYHVKMTKNETITHTNIIMGFIASSLNMETMENISNDVTYMADIIITTTEAFAPAISGLLYGSGLVVSSIATLGIALPVSYLLTNALGSIFDIMQQKKGIINIPERNRRIAKRAFGSGIVALSAAGGIIGSVAAGAAIGGAIGTPIPVIGNIICAVVGALIGAGIGFLTWHYAGEKIFNKCWEIDDETKQKALQFEFAVKYFGFENIDLKNLKQFNLKILRKKYHKKARVCHPDRAKNENEKKELEKEFIQLSTYYALLIAKYEMMYPNMANFMKKMKRETQAIQN